MKNIHDDFDFSSWYFDGVDAAAADSVLYHDSIVSDEWLALFEGEVIDGGMSYAG